MANDVNIHVKTPGAPQAKQELQEVAQGATKVGDNVEQMGSRSSRAMEWFSNGIKSLAGPMGFAALIGVVSSVAGKISQFFENFKNRCDEAVGNLQNVRKGFEGVFQAMSAFDEKSRKGVTTDTINLLKKTSVSQEVGLPVIAQYARQFQGLVQSGQLSPEQYQQGLEGMLGFAARKGGAATPELITLMSGLGMKTPDQQGTFRRQVGAVAKGAGLTIEDMVDVLGRATPTATAMGWQPDEMLNYIGILAAGTVGRQKMALPTATLQALVNPQAAGLKDYRINAHQAENPAKLLQLISAKQQTMNPQAFGRMLNDIYGAEGGAGVYKLLNSAGGDMTSIKNAATPQAAAAEMVEEQTSRQTKERQQALTDAVKTELWTKSDPLFYKKEIRQIGAEERDTLDIEHPYIHKLRENLNPAYAFGIIPGVIANKLRSEGTLKEDAAFVKWYSGLSEEEKQNILNQAGPSIVDKLPGSDVIKIKSYYDKLSSQQQYEGMTGSVSTPQQQSEGVVGDVNCPTINHFHYEHIMNFNPTQKNNLVGPRVDRDFA